MLYSVLLICGGIILCSVTLVVGVDAACVASVNEWVPIYPGAEEVDVQYNMFRPKGMGLTRVTYVTDDPYIEVIRYYQDFQTSVDPLTRNTLATSGYRVNRLDDREGAQITISSECAYN
jgi:hypothetical protein